MDCVRLIKVATDRRSTNFNQACHHQAAAFDLQMWNTSVLAVVRETEVGEDPDVSNIESLPEVLFLHLSKLSEMYHEVVMCPLLQRFYLNLTCYDLWLLDEYTPIAFWHYIFLSSSSILDRCSVLITEWEKLRWKND